MNCLCSVIDANLIFVHCLLELLKFHREESLINVLTLIAVTIADFDKMTTLNRLS
jgi:hypothetical protein